MTKSTRRFTHLALAITATVIAAVATVKIARAEPDDPAPTTRPAASAPRDARDARDNAGSGAFGFGGGRFRPGAGQAMRQALNAEPPITADDIREAEAFMKDAFPVRYHFYEMLPDDRPAKKNLAQMMVRKHRQFRRIQEQQPDLYETMLKQEQLRDQAFGYARDARNGNAEAEDKLRMAVTEMVDLNLKERQARIEKLKKQLDEMMQQLSNDQSQREQKIDEQIDKLMNEIGGQRGRRGGATTKPVG